MSVTYLLLMPPSSQNSLAADARNLLLLSRHLAVLALHTVSSKHVQFLFSTLSQASMPHTFSKC